ncbi:SAM binding domain-containing protein containing protein [Cordyceps militaris CM01]|uniref:SAM binding domain-containing protein containing protein n=1 Tax=Cordyceps militaris (strain CM01) TaxID=983644 RepID=G3J6X2_CORMM|nr:SAM binding domain-containing protein containing protein [Cordyceps militaris CM01]EGX96249.1 SAM binding domain-containing protein containing protein [Cordyceps militaris CM01]
MTPAVLGGRGMLPYIPRAQPSHARRKKANSDPDGGSLTKSTSKSSRASSGAASGEPSSQTSRDDDDDHDGDHDAPLESDRPANAAAVGSVHGHGHDHQHKNQQQQARHAKKKHHDQHDANKTNNNNNIKKSNSAAAAAGTTASGPHHLAGAASPDARGPPPHPHHIHNNDQTHQKPCPSASSSSSSPLLPSASVPKPAAAQPSAFKRASHSFISRGKHHDTTTNQPSPPDASSSKHAHAHPPRNPSSSSRSPAAVHMNGAAPVADFPFVRSLSASAAALAAGYHVMSSTAEVSSSSRENLITTKPFVIRNGRSYLNDSSLPYPLPADLTELHRQSMRTLLLIQVFGSPVCSPVFSTRPPRRVLEIGCGSGFWSMMCHRYFKSRGHGNISFTGIDIAPLAPTTPMASATAGHTAASKPDPEMNWHFISHDLRQLPWPVDNEQFDLVMVKDMSLATTTLQHQFFVDEYIRLLRPGGVLEIWESDHLIRMLRPHVPEAKLAGDDTEDQEAAASLGAYVMNANTPLSAPLNTFLVEYNQWLSRALETRDLAAVPCTLIGPTMLQESETLTDVRSRRLAIPLSEVRWEREGVGGVVVTKDSKAAATSPPPKAECRVLSAGQEALRQTALLTVVQQVQALEPILREASGKSQDEWDVWMGKMMGDLMSDNGTSWGECLEVGAWSATKRK